MEHQELLDVRQLRLRSLTLLEDMAYFHLAKQKKLLEQAL